MKYSDMRLDQSVITELLDKKRLGRRQKERLAMLSTRLEMTDVPPATPPTPITGARADFQGNVYEMHRAEHAPRVRVARRSKRFGRSEIKPMRSRIQRLTRKRRTGGVK